MSVRPFRFGLNILELAGPLEVAALARRAAELDYDVLLVPDHLGMPAPFPTLVAAGATAGLRLGTFVLNAAFHNPALLAREVASTDVLTGGRLELGIGTGYVADEFAAAGIAYGTARDRLDRLGEVVDAVYARLADPELVPRPTQPRVPLLIGGNGNRLLTLAAERADIVAFTGATPAPGDPSAFRVLAGEAFAERVAFFERAAGARAGEIERNLLVQDVVLTDDRDAALAALAERFPYLSAAEFATVPVLLVGTVAQVAAQVRDLRDRFGITYLTVLHPALERFAPVIAALRGT
ncbi:TIGR03621 family F420-dependent LLM class oxidoreductase [Frankia sp. R82]|uniref:TIGR03621 family F420-dependent LLM class oxidoreductase n=1 Tax=Frankia sp. R82 TaxID=2950553 RepID=UPI00204440C0|nr:TIGR03621 family F420-dependent LLM class oxidoreductase [Frankia sp. R82]MCM3882261.1 TIGR03621 family F420-dependent LLM class oxidoreductase [Frankia sp. R82]